MQNSSPYTTFILIALMVVAFYFLIIRPNKKRQQAQQQTMSRLTPGTRVLLSSGLFGTILEIGEKQALLEISPGVELTVLKQAIARIVADGEEDTAWDTFESDDSDAFDEQDPMDPTASDPLGTEPLSTDPRRSSTPDSPSDEAPSHQDPRPGTNPPSNKG